MTKTKKGDRVKGCLRELRNTTAAFCLDRVGWSRGWTSLDIAFADSLARVWLRVALLIVAGVLGEHNLLGLELVDLLLLLLLLCIAAGLALGTISLLLIARGSARLPGGVLLRGLPIGVGALHATSRTFIFELAPSTEGLLVTPLGSDEGEVNTFLEHLDVPVVSHSFCPVLELLVVHLRLHDQLALFVEESGGLEPLADARVLSRLVGRQLLRDLDVVRVQHDVLEDLGWQKLGLTLLALRLRRLDELLGGRRDDLLLGARGHLRDSGGVLDLLRLDRVLKLLEAVGQICELLRGILGLRETLLSGVELAQA